MQGTFKQWIQYCNDDGVLRLQIVKYKTLMPYLKKKENSECSCFIRDQPHMKYKCTHIAQLREKGKWKNYNVMNEDVKFCFTIQSRIFDPWIFSSVDRFGVF